MSPQGIRISTTYKTRAALKNLVSNVKESFLDSLRTVAVSAPFGWLRSFGGEN
jgi:hypothetical protein